MAARAILDIQINDDAFRQFRERFDAYSDQLKELPGEWGRVNQTMSGLQGIMDKLNAASKAGSDKALVVGKVFVDTKKITTDFAALWVGVSKSSHFFHQDILGATLHLTKWTALTGVFSGLLAGGGLFGIARFAMDASAKRQSALALGVTPGEMSSFLVNVGTITADPSGLLSKFSEGFYGQGAKNDFAAAFGSGIGDKMKGKDAASFFADILPDLKRKLNAVPESSLGNYLKSSHLANRGISTEVARNIRAMSSGDVASLSQRLGADARDMNIPSEATKKLQDLDTKLLETWNILSTDVENKLAPLTPSLTALTTAFGKFAGKALESGGALDVVIKDVGDGIDWLAGEIGTPEGREKLITFAKDAALAATTMEVIAKALSGAMAVSSAYGAWKMIGGALSWIPTGAALETGAIMGGLQWYKNQTADRRTSVWDALSPPSGPYPAGFARGSGESFGTHIPSHARGEWEVGQTGPAILHAGEMVVPKEHAEKVRNAQLALSTLSDYPAYNPGQLLVNEEKIGRARVQAHMDWLQGDLGLPKRSAAGITGNLATESDRGRAFHEYGQKWQRGGLSDIQFTGEERVKFEKWMVKHNYPLNSLKGVHEYLLVWPRSREALEVIQDHPEWGTQKVADYWASKVEIPGQAHMQARENEAHRLAGEPVPHRALHRPHHHRHRAHGMHPAHVMLMHRKPEVEIAMEGPGSWTVS